MKKIKTAIIATMLMAAMNTAAQSYKMDINVNGHTMTATMADNSSSAALRKILEQGTLTVSMHDYGNFEKVGSLGHTLPRNDERITTTPGDIILYQGNQITIYYDVNTWSFTRLGHIDDITQSELKNILGDGNVTVTFSLSNPTGISSVSTEGNVVSSEVFTMDGRKVGTFKGEAKSLLKGNYIIRKKLYNNKVITIKQSVK